MEGEGAGKGDTPRPGSKRLWDEHYDQIFKDIREYDAFQRDKEGKPYHKEA